MAGLEAPIQQTQAARLRKAAISAPRLLMSWEDWLTLVPAMMVYLAIAVAIQQADWVRNFPSLAPTVMGGWWSGCWRRARAGASFGAAIALVLGAIVITLAVQGYADGSSVVDRVADVRIRMQEVVERCARRRYQ